MKNYKSSDYAVNKFAKGIVYRFANQTIEITLDDYLRENPNKTERDFAELKSISDNIYLEQVQDENAQTKKDIPLYDVEVFANPIDLPIEEQYIEIKDIKYARDAIQELIESGGMTETQRRRFLLYFFKGMSLRQIATLEGVHFTSVDESICAIVSKIKKIFY